MEWKNRDQRGLDLAQVLMDFGETEQRLERWS